MSVGKDPGLFGGDKVQEFSLEELRAKYVYPKVGEKMAALVEKSIEDGDYEDVDDVREFASKLSIRYPILVGTIDTVLAGRQYGNREGMLPYSVLVDTDGIVRWAYLGALDKDELETQIKALL